MIAAASQLPWFVTRGSGAVALVLLTISMVLGVPTLLSWGRPYAPRLVVQLMHRNISLLVMVFVAIHIATSVVDGFVTIRWIEAVVPFVGTYEPLWLGLGALSMDCLLAVVLSSILRSHISYRLWKQIHLLAYACWPIAVVHTLGIGTDAGLAWMVVLNVACVVAVLAAVAWRLTARPVINGGVTIGRAVR